MYTKTIPIFKYIQEKVQIHNSLKKGGVIKKAFICFLQENKLFISVEKRLGQVKTRAQSNIQNKNGQKDETFIFYPILSSKWLY